MSCWRSYCADLLLNLQLHTTNVNVGHCLRAHLAWYELIGCHDGTARGPIRKADWGPAPIGFAYNNTCWHRSHTYTHGSHTCGVSLQLIGIMVPPAALLLLLWAFGLNFSAAVPQWFQNISTNLFNLSGDIMLGGLFPINILTSNLSQRTVPDNISCQR